MKNFASWLLEDFSDDEKKVANSTSRAAGAVGAKALVPRHVEAVEAKLAGRGRVLLRRSGTEPVVRVMVEGEDGALVESLAEGLAATVKEILVSDKQHCML